MITLRYHRLLLAIVLLMPQLGGRVVGWDRQGAHITHIVNIAHRGGIVPGYPENTLAAFRHAIALHVDVIELDLRGTKDGEVVIMHDGTVDRTTNGKGRVSDLTLAELKKLDAGKGEHIPTYEDVLQLMTGTDVKLLLDIQNEATLSRKNVVQLTEKYNATLNVIVGARTLEDLRTFQTLNPNLRTLGFVRELTDVEPFLQAGVHIMRLWPEWISANPELVTKLHDRGKPVWATADGAPREEMERLISQGVDGILTNFPEMMNSVLADLKKARGL
jgi:glycerophosphoryl diester phosphodiesterase